VELEDQEVPDQVEEWTRRQLTSLPEKEPQDSQPRRPPQAVTPEQKGEEGVEKEAGATEEEEVEKEEEE
jgi:hypothetical protein